MKQQIIKELKRKELRHCVFTWILLLAPVFILMVPWMHYFNWINEVAEEQPLELTDDVNVNLLYALGLICMAFVPLYLILRFSWGIGSYISYRLGWYQNWYYYMNTKQNQKPKTPTGSEWELQNNTRVSKN